MNLGNRPQRKAQVHYLLVKEGALQKEAAETLSFEGSISFAPFSLYLVMNYSIPPFALTNGHKTTHQKVGKMLTISILDISLFKSA